MNHKYHNDMNDRYLDGQMQLSHTVRGPGTCGLQHLQIPAAKALYACVGAPSLHGGQKSAAFPRSATEGVPDDDNKYRQLPCRTFVSAGFCPYKERCIYLHDPRCAHKDGKSKTRRKNKEDVVMDAFYWPSMPHDLVVMKLDAYRLPTVSQPFLVPPPQADEYYRHDAAVYSLWMHFVDFCEANSSSSSAENVGRGHTAAVSYFAPDVLLNSYTNEPRLHIFRALSACNGREAGRDQLVGVTAAAIAPYARRVTIPTVPTGYRPPHAAPPSPYYPLHTSGEAYGGREAVLNPTAGGVPSSTPPAQGPYLGAPALYLQPTPEPAAPPTSLSVLMAPSAFREPPPRQPPRQPMGRPPPAQAHLYMRMEPSRIGAADERFTGDVQQANNYKDMSVDHSWRHHQEEVFWG